MQPNVLELGVAKGYRLCPGIGRFPHLDWRGVPPWAPLFTPPRSAHGVTPLQSPFLQLRLNSLASRSGISISILNNAVEKVFPCASVIKDNVPPPPRLSCKRKFNAPRFGNSNLSTSPLHMPLKCCLTRSAVTSRTRRG